MDPNLQQAPGPQQPISKNSNSPKKYLIVAVLNFLTGTYSIIVPTLLIIVVIPKFLTLYQGVNAPKPDLTISYLGSSLGILFGLVNVFIGTKLLLKSTLNKELFFKIGLTLVILDFLVAGIYQTSILISAVKPLYQLTTFLNATPTISQPSPTPDLYTEGNRSATANWKTYRNTEYGFEFKYPNEWHDMKKFQYEYYISNENATYSHLSRNGLQISFSKQTGNFGLGITQYQTAKEYFDAYLSLKGKDIQLITVDKQSAIKETISDKRTYKSNPNDTDLYYFIMYAILHKNSIYKVLLNGPNNQIVKNNERLFDQILQTIKFL